MTKNEINNFLCKDFKKIVEHYKKVILLNVNEENKYVEIKWKDERKVWKTDERMRNKNSYFQT